MKKYKLYYCISLHLFTTGRMQIDLPDKCSICFIHSAQTSSNYSTENTPSYKNGVIISTEKQSETVNNRIALFAYFQALKCVKSVLYLLQKETLQEMRVKKRISVMPSCSVLWAPYDHRAAPEVFEKTSYGEQQYRADAVRAPHYVKHVAYIQIVI